MANTDVKVVLSATDKTRAAFDSAKRNLSGLSASAAGLTRTLGLAIPALTGAGFVAMAKGAIDAADAFKDMSERTLVSVKDIASLNLVAEQSGTGLEAVAKGIQKITLSVGQAQTGNDGMVESLARLRVTSTDARERLFQIADAYAAAEDKARVTADIQKVLGKSYADLLPLLAQGGDELRKAAQASESFADAMARLAPNADQFNDQMAELKQASAGFAANIMADVVPALNEITRAMREAYVEGGFFKSLWVGLGGLGTAMFTDDFLADVDKLDKLKKQLADIEKLPLPGLVASEAMRNEMRAEIARQEASVAAAEKARIEAAKKAGQPVSANPLRPPSTSGGASKTDPLASFFKATDTARLKEYSALTSELLRRMAGAKGDTSIYVQALDEINKKFADLVVNAEQFDLGGGIMGDWEDLQSLQEAINDANAANTDFKDSLREAGKSIEAEFGNPMDALAQRLSYLDWLLEEGVIGFEAWANAGIAATEASSKFGTETEKAKSFAEEFNLVFESAFTKGIEAAVQGTGDFQDIVKGLAADIIKLIAQLYILEPLLKSIKGGSGGSGGGFDVGSLFSGVGEWFAGLFHEGGVVGAGGAGRMVSPLAFAGAPRYHSGGFAGLLPNEVPAVLMRGEEVLTTRDPRHSRNGGGRQIVNNITIQARDPAEVRLSRGAMGADVMRAMRQAQRWA